MNTVCASTYVYLLQFLSSVSYNFPSTGLLHPWLNLFLGIYFFFDAVVKGIVFFVPLYDSSLMVYTNATDFWIFSLCPSNLLKF